MSRIGKQPIKLPTNTTVNLNQTNVLVKGPKGELTVEIIGSIQVSQSENLLQVQSNEVESRSYQGLIRTLIQNAVTGVSEGWKKDLELNGVGMRASMNGNNLILNLGFSHPINFPAPQGITFNINKNQISITGIDKQLVGETAAQIRALRKPEPYKGKGIRYSTEYVRRKAGKTGKTGK
jgi:large subunit ribosomal protein L6